MQGFVFFNHLSAQKVSGDVFYPHSVDNSVETLIFSRLLSTCLWIVLWVIFSRSCIFECFQKIRLPVDKLFCIVMYARLY